MANEPANLPLVTVRRGYPTPAIAVEVPKSPPKTRPGVTDDAVLMRLNN